MQGETDRLGGDCTQTQLRTVDRDPRPDKIRKVRELRTPKSLDIYRS
jgi:hypothetical protein